MTFVVRAAPVSPHVPIVRGRLIVLRAKIVVFGLRRMFGGWRRLHRRRENGRRRYQQQKAKAFFHQGCSEG